VESNKYSKILLNIKWRLKMEDKLKQALTIIGWIIIGFAVIALIMFVINSGVLG